jgi:hypothetical protein
MNTCTAHAIIIKKFYTYIEKLQYKLNHIGTMHRNKNMGNLV